jgi:protein phosphatase
MGCTLVGGVLLDNTAVLANVGDSRAYDISEEVVQLTTDQTVANELVEEGKLTPAEAEDHQMAHVLQQSIGPTDELEPEIFREQFNDRLLLCSDGLTNELDDGQLAELGQRDALSTACEELIGAANDAGGRDNISVVVCSVND